MIGGTISASLDRPCGRCGQPDASIVLSYLKHPTEVTNRHAARTNEMLGMPRHVDRYCPRCLVAMALYLDGVGITRAPADLPAGRSMYGHRGVILDEDLDDIVRELRERTR